MTFSNGLFDNCYSSFLGQRVIRELYRHEFSRVQDDAGNEVATFVLKSLLNQSCQAFKSIFGGGKAKVSAPVLSSTPPSSKPSTKVEAQEQKPPTQTFVSSSTSSIEPKKSEPLQTKPKAKEHAEAATLKVRPVP